MAITASSQIGRYRVVTLVGAGGMGQVYRVQESGSGQVWALKTILPGNREGSDLWKRFVNEAQIQSQLEHSHVPAFREMFLYEGQPCIVMEYVEGETVAARLARLGALDSRDAAAILAQVCGALAYLHSKGITHRDLKSSNLKLTPQGEVKLLDFGIAFKEGSKRLTRVGAIIGTPESLAPELLEGKAAGLASEMWGLGVLGYEMVTGSLPFTGANDEELWRKVRNEAPVPPSELNPGVARDLEKILLRCLEKNPARRYETMESLERALWKIAGRDATRPLQAPAYDARLREEASHVSPDVAGTAEKWVAQFRQAWADPRLRKWIIAGAVALVLIVAAVMNSGPAGQGDQIVTIEVTNGKADVYENGEKVGATPYQRRARLGDSLHLQLRRSGALDQDIDFDVTERHVYSYTMQTR
ncbi:MAG TPA: serine/threonine-protein kinase [Bryobacteraceae bacterium]|jgi:serine/threonine-protein kinase